MLERRVSGVPVIDADGQVVGVISEADVVRAETGGTGGQGMVVLTGEVDTETNAKLAAFFATRVPGVVAVRSELQARDAGEGSSTD